jgi:thioredoxin 1
MSQLTVVTSEQFTETLGQGVVLVDFYAVWCQPCQALTPILEQVAEKLGDKASIVKIDVDESTDVALK